MANVNLENEELINTYASDTVNHIDETIKSINIQYYSKHRVSEELYRELKISRYDLIFLIKSAEKEILGEKIDLANLIEAKEKLALLKEKNNNIATFKTRVNYLYHVLSNVTYKLAFYSQYVDYSKSIKRK